MVLLGIGKRINDALSSLVKAQDVDQELLDTIVKEIATALLESDFNVKLVARLKEAIYKQVNLTKVASVGNKRRLVQKTVFEELCRLVNPECEAYKPKKRHANVFMMVGLQGSGKTTSCTKLALYYQRLGYKSCLVCADTFRAGAFDQLKQNAIKNNIPFFGSYTEADPVKTSLQGVEIFKRDKFEIIIVDTSGRHMQEENLFTEMKNISRAITPNLTIMVLDANIGQAAEAQALAFKESAEFGAIIITKMDGGSKAGGALSAVASTKTPVLFLGTGEHATDFEKFKPESYISKLLGMGDLDGFLEHIEAMNKSGGNKSTMKNIQQGKFTLRDMTEQINNILKMGPLTKVAALIPGMSQIMPSDEEDGTDRLKRMLYIIDSMNQKELDSDGSIFKQEPSRITRVARGSGTSVREVEDTLSQVKVFSNMAKNLGGNQGLLKKLSAAQGLKPHNFAQMQKKMTSMNGMQNLAGMDFGEMMKMASQMDLGPLMKGMFTKPRKS